MTDTHHPDPRDEAADQIQAVRDHWAPTTPPASVLIDGLATDTLRRLIEQRTLTPGPAPLAPVHRACGQRHQPGTPCPTPRSTS